MTAGQKKLILKLMENQLSPIPEIANSACVSPELIKYNEKSPVSKSAKVLSPSCKFHLQKKVKKQEVKPKKTLYTAAKVKKSAESSKKEEKELETFQKQKIFKIVKLQKTGNFWTRESPKRVDSEVKLDKKSVSVPRIKISAGLEGKQLDRKVLEKLKKNEENSQFLGRRKQKALTQNSQTTRHIDANCREVQDIMNNFRKYIRTKYY